MMPDKGKKIPAPPEIGPYALPIVLAAMGVWCFYDGWITSNPEMLEHVMFNRVASVGLLIGTFVSFIWIRSSSQKGQEEAVLKDPKRPDDS